MANLIKFAVRRSKTLGDIEPKTILGTIGLVILGLIYVACCSITYPFRLAGYFWNKRWYYKQNGSWPETYDWPKWRS